MKKLWGDEYIYYLDCGDSFLGISYVNTYIIYFKYVQFIAYHLYVNKALIKKNNLQ